MGSTQIGITTILNGRVTERVALVKDRILVGRSADCDVRIDHAGVSRLHAVISSHAGAVSIEDLESSNGTRVNGKPTRNARLHNGDVVQIGNFSLHVAFVEDPGGSKATGALHRREEQTVAMPSTSPTIASAADVSLATPPTAPV